MLSIQEIRDKYGYMSSFALWKKIDETKKPKYGIGDIEHFENLEEKDITPTEKKNETKPNNQL